MDVSTDCCIAFVANGQMLQGLYSALGSLVTAMKADQIEVPVVVFCEGIPEQTKAHLHAQLTRKSAALQLRFEEGDARLYKGLRSHQGDHMSYFRLGLPRLLPQYRKILYLDCDVILKPGLRELLEMELHDHLFAAGGVGPVSNALERDFFLEIGLEPKSKICNSGLLLINVRKWLDQDVESQAIAFGLEHWDSCDCADQTVINALFADRFLPLPTKFNCDPNEHPDADAVVVHLLGAPKPWDFLGSWLHKHHAVWREAAAEAGYEGLPLSAAQIRSSLTRTWAIRRSLARALWQKLRSVPTRR